MDARRADRKGGIVRILWAMFVVICLIEERLMCTNINMNTKICVAFHRTFVILARLLGSWNK